MLLVIKCQLDCMMIILYSCSYFCYDTFYCFFSSYCVLFSGHCSVHAIVTLIPLLFSDFLPMFIYVLVHCGLVAAEIEADYMWGLLHPSLLAGEGGYYLTTLSSAVHVLKNFTESQESLEIQVRNTQKLKGESRQRHSFL